LLLLLLLAYFIDLTPAFTLPCSAPYILGIHSPFIPF